MQKRWMAGVALSLATMVAGASEPPPAAGNALARIAAEADDAEKAARFSALWGHDARLPVVVHDPATGSWWRPPGSDRVIAFALRKDQPAANTCLDAGSQPRVLLLLPLPEGSEELTALVWHERWHCVQAKLGLPAREADNAHLASEAGRTWLRLELRALARALANNDPQDARHAALHALAFRAQRSDRGRLGTGALVGEAQVERNEGLAEYTGRKLAAQDPIPSLLAALESADDATSYVRSAAYATGPAYGLLLDRWDDGWTRSVDAEVDLPSMLAAALVGDAPLPEAESAGAAYGLAAVRIEEAERAAETRRKRGEYESRFVTGEALTLPLRNPSVSFDPRTLFPLDAHGTVYAPITVRDAWGELVAEGGALLASDWSSVRVSAEKLSGNGIRWQGPGWALILAAGWRLEKDANGHWTLREGSSAAQ